MCTTLPPSFISLSDSSPPKVCADYNDDPTSCARAFLRLRMDNSPASGAETALPCHVEVNRTDASLKCSAELGAAFSLCLPTASPEAPSSSHEPYTKPYTTHFTTRIVPSTRTVIIPLVCSPRFGSSLVESLIGESPEVLELQEMFNAGTGFAHSPHAEAALKFFERALLPPQLAPSDKSAAQARDVQLHRVINQNHSQAVHVAADMARAWDKRAVTYKVFAGMYGYRPTLAELVRDYSQDSVAILLERNAFAAFISLDKIAAHCSGFQVKDSTTCRLTISETGCKNSLRKHMATQCLQRAWVGVQPFAAHSGVRTVVLRYEVLDRFHTTLDQKRYVQQMVAAVSPGALKPYKSNGFTSRHYRQQDKNHTLASSISNLAEMHAWWTTEARLDVCNYAATVCFNAVERDPLSLAGQAGLLPSKQDLRAWCTSSYMLDFDA